MLIAIACRYPATEPPRFAVFRHVVLPGPLLQASDIRIDGSLVGAYGQLGLHDGQEYPLIVKQGKCSAQITANDLNLFHLAANLGGGRFEMQDDRGHTRAARLAGSQLVLEGPMKAVPLAESLIGHATAGNAEVDKLYPVPENMRDTSANESIVWWTLSGGFALGQVNTSTNMEYGHRVFLQDSKGRPFPLERYVRGLSGYEADGVWFVSPHGWLVVSASDAGWDPRAGIRTGFGKDLFWLKPIQS